MRCLLTLMLLAGAGCSGPVALDRAIWPRHEREYANARQAAPDSPREAWFVLQVGDEPGRISEVRAADAALSTTRNPFDARRDPEAVSRGALIYRENCARCHGLDARGNGPDMLPAHPTHDFHAFGKRFAVTLHGGAPRTWFRKINEGYGPVVAQPTGSSRAMPAFGDVLARERIWLAITYLQSLDIYAQPAPIRDADATGRAADL